MSNEIITYNVSDLQTMAVAMASSGLFGFKRKEEAFALMLIAQAEGRHPATIAQDYDIIQGRPAIKSRAALSRFQSAGGKIEWLERSDKVCRARFSHPQSSEVEICWTIERAALAGLSGKDNWKRMPQQMLAARCVSEGVGACLPKCLSSFYLAEEVQDFEPKSYPIDRRNEIPQLPTDPTPPTQQEQPKEKSVIEITLDVSREQGLSDEVISDRLMTEDWLNASPDGIKRLQAECNRVFLLNKAAAR